MKLIPVSYCCETVGELRLALQDYDDATPLLPPVDTYALVGRDSARLRLLPRTTADAAYDQAAGK